MTDLQTQSQDCNVQGVFMQESVPQSRFFLEVAALE